MSETPAVYQVAPAAGGDTPKVDSAELVPSADRQMADAIEYLLERMAESHGLARHLHGTEAYSLLAGAWLRYCGVDLSSVPDLGETPVCIIWPDALFDLVGKTRPLTSLIRWHRPSERKPEPGIWVAIYRQAGNDNRDVASGVRLHGTTWAVRIGDSVLQMAESDVIAWTELPATGVLPAPEGGAS
jgi:hypothetical protein